MHVQSAVYRLSLQRVETNITAYEIVIEALYSSDSCVEAVTLADLLRITETADSVEQTFSGGTKSRSQPFPTSFGIHGASVSCCKYAIEHVRVLIQTNAVGTLYRI